MFCEFRFRSLNWLSFLQPLVQKLKPPTRQPNQGGLSSRAQVWEPPRGWSSRTVQSMGAAQIKVVGFPGHWGWEALRGLKLCAPQGGAEAQDESGAALGQ